MDSLPKAGKMKQAPKSTNMGALTDVVTKAKEQDRLNIENSANNVVPSILISNDQDQKSDRQTSEKSTGIEKLQKSKKDDKKRESSVSDNDLNSNVEANEKLPLEPAGMFNFIS